MEFPLRRLPTSICLPSCLIRRMLSWPSTLAQRKLIPELPPKSCPSARAPACPTYAYTTSTSFSKFAFCTRRQGVVSRWKEGHCTVPSRVYIGPGGATRVNPPNPPSAEWQMVDIFKLFLLHHGDWPSHARTSPLIRGALNRLLDCPLEVDKVVSEYITILWRGASATAAASLGRESLWGLDVRVVITVPAQWPVDAISRMKRAIGGSGIPGTSSQMEWPIMMVEPEAAIVACVGDLDGISNGPGLPEVRLNSRIDYRAHSMQERSLSLAVEARFHHRMRLRRVDCSRYSHHCARTPSDARAGLRRDVATYGVTNKDETGYSLERVGVADGEICGGLFLDDAFLAVLRDKVGAIFPGAPPTEIPGQDFLDEALEWWRTSLRLFTGPLDETEEFDIMSRHLVGPGIEPSHPGAAGRILSLTGFVSLHFVFGALSASRRVLPSISPFANGIRDTTRAKSSHRPPTPDDVTNSMLTAVGMIVAIFSGYSSQWSTKSLG